MLEVFHGCFREQKHKGTFEAVSDRINYIKKLGFTSILLMPVYEFEEMTIPVKHDIPEYAKPKYSLKDEQSVHTENDKVNFGAIPPAIILP